MHKELVALYSAVSFPVVSSDNPVDPGHVSMFNREIAALGYTFDATVIQKMQATSSIEFFAARDSILNILFDLSGASSRHQTLFRSFPHQTPDQADYLLRRVLGHIQNKLNYEPNSFSVLSCGHVIDTNLFDLDEFGACPICQQQVAELPWRERQPNMPFQRITPLKILAFADDDFLREKGSALLARNSSLSADEKAFVRKHAAVGYTLPSTAFKETLPLLYDLFDVNAIPPFLSGATDVLRIAVYCSNPEADLSLKEPTKLKLATRHKRKLLTLLESRSNLEEDLLRYHERWKRFARHVHIGSAENRRRFPKTVSAFDRIRNDPKSVETFGRIVEGKMRAKQIDERLLTTLERRPGEFVRRLDFLLRTQTKGALGHMLVLSTFERVAKKVTTKLLFEVQKYLEHRATVHGSKRAFYPKGNANKVQILEDRRPPIDDMVLIQAIDIIGAELAARFSQQEKLGRVYVDEKLREVLIPMNRRGDSSSNVAVPKGTRVSFGDAPVCRLFIHWTGYDVDLSLISYTADLNQIEQISWTNTKGLGCVHSGDVQRAPNGASEFIDFEIETFRRRGVRYVITSAISFSGDTFDTFPAYAGYMERDALKSGKVYEPESVALKFNLTAKTRSYMPLIFDLDTREVIFADLATGGGRYGAVANQDEKHQTLLRAVLDLPLSKPTAYDVVRAHVLARGTQVDDPAQADIVFERDSIDMEAVQAMMG